MRYRHLTQIQRYQIHARHYLGTSQRQTGRELGIHSSTISRELRRNVSSGAYDPEQAQTLSDHRRHAAWKWTKRLQGMIATVFYRLREEWNPQQISEFMAPLACVSVSHKWIYSFIWDHKAKGGDLWRHLRQPKRRNKHRAQAKSAGLGKTPNRIGIEHRPAEVDERLFIVHWEEGDTLQAIRVGDARGASQGLPIGGTVTQDLSGD
jgi:transposase, IS30 family